MATNDKFGANFLDAIERIMTQFEGVQTICVFSNISYGLPEWRLLSQVFAVMAISKGLDSLIVNPIDKEMMGHILAAEPLAGRDIFL
jgi:cobalamin-dependent methionine synthase I